MFNDVDFLLGLLASADIAHKDKKVLIKLTIFGKPEALLILVIY